MLHVSGGEQCFLVGATATVQYTKKGEAGGAGRWRAIPLV